MTLLCERCYGPIDPERESFYRLAHIAHADRHGEVTWNVATVHTRLCGAQAIVGHGQEREAA